jgi:hypothetical protein
MPLSRLGTEASMKGIRVIATVIAMSISPAFAADAADNSDPLKSVVGVWTYPDKQVWIVVRQDGSATQCRIGPDGAVYFSKGAFRAPNILAWEKNWGDDQVVREKDAITLTGKFGSFSYKLDDSGRPSDRCRAT